MIENAAEMAHYFSSTRIVLIPNYVRAVLVHHLAVEIARLSHKDFFKITLYGTSAFRNIVGNCILNVYQFFKYVVIQTLVCKSYRFPGLVKATTHNIFSIF